LKIELELVQITHKVFVKLIKPFFLSVVLKLETKYLFFYKKKILIH